MAVGDACVFPGYLTPVLTQLFFPKPPTTFCTCFCTGGRRKCARKKVRLDRNVESGVKQHSVIQQSFIYQDIYSLRVYKQLDIFNTNTGLKTIGSGNDERSLFFVNFVVVADFVYITVR